MILKQIKLTNFRNFDEQSLNFKKGIQVVFGENGQGKTNLLESIYFLAITKSFRTGKDQHLLKYNQPYFNLLADLESSRNHFTVRSYWDEVKAKNFWMNGEKTSSFQDYIGTIPIVLLIPSDLEISKGAPGERRRFFDLLLGQADQKYLKDLIQYRRFLRHKNKILMEEKIDRILVESITHHMAEVADHLNCQREKLVQWLNGNLAAVYSKLTGKNDQVQIEFQPSLAEKGNYQTTWNSKVSMEIKRKRTLIGPHLDDFIIWLNGQPIRHFGSQGENKTLVIALKLCEYNYLNQHRQERPIMLFDDIFGELDKNRINNMLNALGEIAQVFVTTTSPNFFNKLDISVPVHYFRVSDGRVEETELEN